ncbi:cation transporter [Ursidibacter arcticus]
MPKEHQFLLSGLHCAACVHRIEKVVGKIPNVEFV